MYDEDSSSDVEILNPGTLRTSYFRQQIRLIQEIKHIDQRIPKDWELFKEFVEKTVNWKPSEKLICSVWKKMCQVEDQLRGNVLPPPVVELSDDDDDSSIVSVIHTPPAVLLGDKKDEIIVSDDETLQQSASSSSFDVPKSGSKPQNTVKKRSRKKSLRLSNGERSESDSNISGIGDVSIECPSVERKRKKKKIDHPITEAEAQLLRERLIIDKIIELELPNVIKSLLNKMPLVTPTRGRKRKRITI